MHLQRITLACRHCGRLFSVEPYRRETARYCSQRCTARGRPPRKYPPAEERLWANVVRTDDLFSCWVWTGSLDTKGYGQLRVNGRREMTHRLAWELANGPIPDGMCVLHRCDNPRCVRPSHLFLGTKGDNNSDRHAKGRTVSPRGPRKRRGFF